MVVLLAALCGCGEGAGPSSTGPVSLQRVVDDPGAYDGERVEVTAGYFSSFEVSVLTTGFAESYPPQPMDPEVWVGASPPDDCLEVAEGASWSEDVVATGTFHFEDGGGFGHVGAYRMELEGATLRCA